MGRMPRRVNGSAGAATGLGERVLHGDSSLDVYLRDIDAVPLLSESEERALAQRVQDGDRAAREQLVRANLRLVVSLARRYARRGMPLADLIEEGNVGLLRAVELYDPDQGARFATYATWWIKQSIRRALSDKVRTVRLPAYMLDIVARFKRAESELEERLGRRPTPAEVTATMEVPFENVELLAQALAAEDGGARALSLEALLGTGQSLPDPRAPEPGDAGLDEDVSGRLRAMLDQLAPRDAEILRLRYGLDDQDPLSLREIGTRLGISHERVRQLELRALARMAEEFRPDTPDA
jgi:RNA polymerase primary sigma factor